MSLDPSFVWHDGDTGGTLVTAARLNDMWQGIIAAAAGGNPFSVKSQYGAAGDGVTDDTTELNAAFAAGGLVYLDAGDYKVTGQLYVYSTTKTVVTGPGRIVSTFNNGIIRINNAPHVLDGITILGGGGTLTVQGGIMVDGPDVTVTRCHVSNLARFGIYSAADNVRIIDNVTDSTTLGTDRSSASVAAIFNSGDGVRIEGNTCTNTDWGISNRGNSATDPIYDGIIVNNRISASPTAPTDAQGISSAHGRHQKIAFNTIRGYPNNCIDQYGAFYSEIVGNTCIDGSSDGIFVGHVGTKSITVANNNIYRCAGAGIRVWDTASDIKVIGNNIYDVGAGNGSGAVGIRASGSINTGESDINNVDIQNNYIDGAWQSGQTTSIGILVQHAFIVDVSGNTVRNVARQGIYGENTVACTVRNNRVQGAGSAGAYAAIHTAVGCVRWLIDDALTYGTSSIAVRVESGTGHRVRGLRWAGGTPTGVSDTATGTTLADNLAF